MSVVSGHQLLQQKNLKRIMVRDGMMRGRAQFPFRRLSMINIPSSKIDIWLVGLVGQKKVVAPSNSFYTNFLPQLAP